MKQQKDLTNSKLVDIAFGRTSTGLIFERKDGTLHGIKVMTKHIELCDFEKMRDVIKGAK